MNDGKINEKPPPPRRRRKTAAPNPDPAPPFSPFDPMAKDKRWKIRGLPENLRTQLDSHLSGGTFQSFQALSQWLEQNGFRISPAALRKYARNFDLKLDAIRLATQQARIVCEQFKDDDETMHQALMRLVQTQLFQVLVSANEKQPSETGLEQDGCDKNRRDQRRKGDDAGALVAPINIHAVARSVAGLARSEAEYRKRTEHAREKIAQAGKKVDEARDQGLTSVAADQIKAVLMDVWE